MREWLEKFKPNPWLSKKLLMAAVLIGVGVAAFCLGRRHAGATQPGSPEVGATANAGTEGYRSRVVAYVYNQPVFREELGEYLIARFGAERLDFLINHKIVETECRKHNIVVADAEVEARFDQDLNSFGMKMTQADFVNNILKRFNKTLYEWKEDVIRPKIMMEKLVRASVEIKDADVREGFEARYGPKVECRMIVMDKDQHRLVDQVWTDVHNSRDAFIEKAKHQAIPNLASAGGLVPPIHKHFGDKDLEDAAFRLKEGEVSTPIQMKDGSFVILLCERHLPENKNVRYEHEWQKISKEMEELRVAQRIPEVFKELHKAANPQLILKNEGALVSVRTDPPRPTVQPPVGQAPVQMPPNTPLPPPAGLAPPSPAPEKK